MPRSAPALLASALLCGLVIVVGASAARANVTVEGTRIDPASCVRAPQAGPGAAPAGPATDAAAPPVTWSGFEVTGEFSDAAEVVRALFEPTMSRHRAMTDAAREDVTQIANAYGYHLVTLRTRDIATGTLAVIHLSPRPMVRRVTVDIDVPLRKIFSSPILDDEIKRRMRLRTGSYLPWTPTDRGCELVDEKRRLEEFLRDEGYIEGRVAIAERRKGRGVSLDVEVTLGPEYDTGVIDIADREPNNVGDDEIRKLFRHQGNCLIWTLCIGTARFTRAQHQADLQKVVKLFHQRGYPAVRVRSDFDPRISINRRKKTVDFTITVDQRRQLEVVFEGYDPLTIQVERLREQLTFNDAASSDDVEANDSARAITSYLQGRGFFDARATWIRERFDRFDRIIYRIDQGALRRVEAVELVGNRALDDDTLRDVISTQETRVSFFGSGAAATSAALALDVERLVDTYRRAGYRDARVTVAAATEPVALHSVALTAALLVADRGTGLHVRFTIDEGLPTLLTQVRVELGGGHADELTSDDDRALCKLVLDDLAGFYAEPQLATLAVPDRCVATAANLKYREADASETQDRLKDRLYSHGRPRAAVDYAPVPIGPHRVAAVYKLSDVQPLQIGKVVIRGNFKTRTAVIRDLLRLKEGAPLTKDALAEGARRLRNTGLFDAVNVAMPDLENISDGEVNAVVEITERFDYKARIDTEVGYSSYNGAFIKLIPSFKNLFGRGVSLDLAGTIGFAPSEALLNQNLELRQLSAEATLRIPQWLSGRLFKVPDWLEFQTELTAFRRRQDTPRFGVINTDGATLALSRTWQRPRIGNRAARAITIGPHYTFRLRERPVDVLRPSGADDAETQVPISTRTGAVGVIFEWEQRVDRSGTLSPLAPEAGFRLEGQVSFASPYLAGQDTFVKVSGAASRYWSIGSNLVLRGDLRYDQGFPLGGAVLLPEVERFFAGGDSTVRGYEDDRLATELIRVGVPPLDNVEQIRILPAGGNIRLMSSIDAQLRVWKVLATAVFVDAGMITNQWTTVTEDDIRPSIGVALIRIVTPFGTGALERAMPLRPQLGDDPRGRWHLSFAARAQF